MEILSNSSVFWDLQLKYNNTVILVVIYWPSTELSIKRCTCVNKWKNSGSRWAWDNYITRCPGAVWVSWRQDAKLRASDRQRALGPQWPTVKQPQAKMRKKCCYGRRRTWGQYISLSPSPAHLSHTTNINPFENKVWEIYL